MSAMELLLVRHGESTANVARERAEAAGAEVIDVEARDADVPLSELGRRQALALGACVAQRRDLRFDAVWSSPYARAAQTATGILDGAGAAMPVRVDERLRDKELGVLDTLTVLGVRNRFPGEDARRRFLGKFYYRAPGGESWADVALRVRSALADIARSGAGRVLVVTHDCVVMLIRYVCEQLDERALLDIARANPLGNTALTRLVGDGARWQLYEFNWQEHLLVGGADLRTTHPADQRLHPQAAR
jgi:broad specificity phosphatase PhoE